jgi:hypothetical protein
VSRIHDVQAAAPPFRSRIDAAAPVIPASATRPAVWEAAYSDEWRRFIPVQVAGRAAVDTAGMTSRVEDLLEATLGRL